MRKSRIRSERVPIGYCGCDEVDSRDSPMGVVSIGGDEKMIDLAKNDALLKGSQLPCGDGTSLGGPVAVEVGIMEGIEDVDATGCDGSMDLLLLDPPTRSVDEFVVKPVGAEKGGEVKRVENPVSGLEWQLLVIRDEGEAYARLVRQLRADASLGD